MIRLLCALFVCFMLAMPASADFTAPPGGPPGGGGGLPPGGGSPPPPPPSGGGGSGGSGGGSSSAASSSKQAISNSAIVVGSLACMAGSAILDDAVVDIKTFAQYSMVPCAAAGGAVYLVVASGGAATPAVIVGVVVYYGGRYFFDIFPPHERFRPTILHKYPHLSEAEVQFRCSEVRKNRYRDCTFQIPGITTP